jgi:hypothetical protein
VSKLNHTFEEPDELGDIDLFKPFMDALARRWIAQYGRDYSKTASDRIAQNKTQDPLLALDGSTSYRYPRSSGTYPNAPDFSIEYWQYVQTEVLNLSVQFAKSTGSPADVAFPIPRPDISGDVDKTVDFYRECESAPVAAKATEVKNVFGGISYTWPDEVTIAKWPSITRNLNFRKDPTATTFERWISDVDWKFYKWPPPNGFTRLLERWIYTLACPGVEGQLARFVVRNGGIYNDFWWENETKVFLGGLDDPAKPGFKIGSTPAIERKYAGELMRFKAGSGKSSIIKRSSTTISSPTRLRNTAPPATATLSALGSPTRSAPPSGDCTGFASSIT